MASLEETLRYVQQTHIECDGCDGIVTVTVYCLTCKANLCDKCKTARLHRGHRILLWMDQEAIRARQNIPSKCQYHPEQEYLQFCKRCETPCCPICIDQSHKGHNLAPFCDIAEDIMKKTVGFVKTLDENLSFIRQKKVKINERLNMFESEMESTKIRVCNRARRLTTDIENLKKETILELDSAQEQAKTQLQSQVEKLNSDEEKVELEIKKYKEKLSKTNIAALSLLLSKIFDVEMNKLRDTPDVPLPQFVEAAFEITNPTEIIGAVRRTGTIHEKSTQNRCDKTYDIEILRTFAINYKPLALCSDAKTGVWVYKANPPAIYKYDEISEGQMYRCDLNLIAITVNVKGEIFGIDYNNRTLLRLQIGGVCTALRSFAHEFPTSLCMNLSGDIVISLEKDYNQPPFGLTVQSSENIGEWHSIEVHGIVSRIESIACKSNGDYIVAESEKLTCVSTQGEVIWVFKGEKSIDNPPQFNSVCCDSEDNVILCNYSDQTVCVLDSKGHLIRALLHGSSSEERPLSATIDFNQNIWFGLSNKTIKVFKRL